MTKPRDEEVAAFIEADVATRCAHEYGPGGLLEWELEEDPQPEPAADKVVTTA